MELARHRRSTPSGLIHGSHRMHTLQVLWDEYIVEHPSGYRYSRFCDLHRSWAMKLTVTMRQKHAPGENLFVDYAGDKIGIVVDRLTGEIRDAHIFAAVLGASSLTYAEGSWTETLPDWLTAHSRALSMFGGAPRCSCPTMPQQVRSTKLGINGAYLLCRYIDQPHLILIKLIHFKGVAVVISRICTLIERDKLSRYSTSFAADARVKLSVSFQ